MLIQLIVGPRQLQPMQSGGAETNTGPDATITRNPTVAPGITESESLFGKRPRPPIFVAGRYSSSEHRFYPAIHSLPVALYPSLGVGGVGGQILTPITSEPLVIERRRKWHSKALGKDDLLGTKCLHKLLTGQVKVRCKPKITFVLFGCGVQLADRQLLAQFTQNASTGFKDKVQYLRCHAKFKVKVRSGHQRLYYQALDKICATHVLQIILLICTVQQGYLIGDCDYSSIKFGSRSRRGQERSILKLLAKA